ncbi:hypothetical protein C7212DRAFT_273691 [Tuber magnatum]|uniref:Uncharacterized protein n=1 Tax=Tuber magnatum TaxID=42249 RepID=A0A317T0E9_9PEZI|nr:hypothetical protein C7212DRAFT_273691 [Tuber magnatum]
METLPTEVFNEILDQFEPGLHELPRANPWARPRPYKPEHIDSKQHFARLRLVSKRFSELAAPYLFRSIGLRFNMKSFGRLERLSEQPKLAKHVKKFVYLMPYLYVEGKDREPFYYPTVYKEQQDVMRGSYDLFVLKKAMKSFTSLQQIQLLSVMVHKDIVLRNLASSFDNWDFIDCRWIPACSHAAETLLLAILYGKPPVNSFSSPTLSPQSLLAISSGMQQSALASFKQLSHLEVTFDERPDRSYLDTATTHLRGHISPISEFFRQFCMCTVNLSTLYLRFTPGLPVRLPLEDVFHNTVWSKLRVLGIGSWMLRAEEIIGIAKRHQGTLKGIRLSEVYLADGDRWRDVVIALKTHMKTLDWVSFQDIGYESEHVRKVSYIETYSDSSSEGDEDDSLEMDTESISSSSSHVHSSQAGDDVIYGNVFTSSEDTGISSDTSSLGDGANAGMGNLGEKEECEFEEDLEDYGLTVSQAQRKHWERWIVGKNVNRGEPYTRPL